METVSRLNFIDYHKRRDVIYLISALLAVSMCTAQRQRRALAQKLHEHLIYVVCFCLSSLHQQQMGTCPTRSVRNALNICLVNSLTKRAPRCICRTRGPGFRGSLSESPCSQVRMLRIYYSNHSLDDMEHRWRAIMLSPDLPCALQDADRSPFQSIIMHQMAGSDQQLRNDNYLISHEGVCRALVTLDLGTSTATYRITYSNPHLVAFSIHRGPPKPWLSKHTRRIHSDSRDLSPDAIVPLRGRDALPTMPSCFRGSRAAKLILSDSQLLVA